MIVENLKTKMKYKVLFDLVCNATNGISEFGVVYQSLEQGTLFYRNKQEFDLKFKILNEVSVALGEVCELCKSPMITVPVCSNQYCSLSESNE